MARQTGLTRYSGTMGGVRHFKIKGLSGDFAGMVGGPSGDQILTAPEFERTRENMNEFGGCATAGKSIRTGLSQVIKQMSDPQMTGRLTGIIKKINIEDETEKRGRRAILISQERQYLTGFAFDRNVSLEGVFTAPYTLNNTPARDSGTLTVAAFNPANLVNAPAGATHFRLIVALACISDFEYNDQTGSYEPIDAANNELSYVAYSGYLDLSAAIATSTVVTATLPGSPTLTADASVLFCVGIEFFQQVNSEYYLFNSGNALKIASIF
ncbi:hypothetical protein FC093_20200 [Ilyomonas limi]|uniref:Uncharacterized protein n=1 Tax=Ilyomonas limi TaxID=2575867 RepID=A0A4U3KSJ0_9BACT|nr:hypothetical protein [Ilyomonas limi]TKK65435.1 hypothetical protein FC093_20200 [Ilyomonas limi]